MLESVCWMRGGNRLSCIDKSNNKLGCLHYLLKIRVDGSGDGYMAIGRFPHGGASSE